MYVILEDNRGRLSICPQNWIITSTNGIEKIYWPKSNQNILVDDPDSKPVVSGTNEWLVVGDRVKRRNIPSKSEAEREMDRMLKKARTETETDDDDEESNVSKLRSQSKKVVTKSAAKMLNIPKFDVPNALTQTPPNSVLKSNSMVSAGASPRTPKNKLLRDIFLSQPQITANSTLPSAMVTDDIVAMQSVFSDSIIPMKHEFEILANEVLTNDSIAGSENSKIHFQKPSNDVYYMQDNGDILDKYGNKYQGNTVCYTPIATNEIPKANSNAQISSVAVVETTEPPTATDSILQVIVNNQENLANRIINLEKGVQDINSQLFDLTSWIKNNINSRPPSAMSMMSSISNMSSTTEPAAAVIFKLISDENDLHEFEKGIEDVSYRLKICNYFVKLLNGGKNLLSAEQDDKTQRSIALQLERNMLEESFWSKTAWTGGRKMEGPKKFVFATHITFMNFFNDVIHRVCGSQMSQIEFAEFVKSRTRNSGYVRSTARLAAARTSHKRKRVDYVQNNLEKPIQLENETAENAKSHENAEISNNEE